MSQAVLTYMRFIALAVLVVVAACSAPAGSRDSTVPLPSAPPTTVRATSAFGTPSPRTAVGDYLADELGSVTLHTFPVAQDVTARLGEAAGVPLELAYASEHGARFIQTIAIRAPATDPNQLVELFPAAAFPPDGTSAEISSAELAGEPVIALADPATTARLGTYYLLTRDDVLIVIEAFRPEDAADMVAALPQR